MDTYTTRTSTTRVVKNRLLHLDTNARSRMNNSLQIKGGSHEGKGSDRSKDGWFEIQQQQRVTRSSTRPGQGKVVASMKEAYEGKEVCGGTSKGGGSNKVEKRQGLELRENFSKFPAQTRERRGEKPWIPRDLPSRPRQTVQWWEQFGLVAEDSNAEIYPMYIVTYSYHLLTHLCRFPLNGAKISIKGQ